MWPRQLLVPNDGGGKFSITLLFFHGAVAPIPDESPDNGPDAINHLIPDSQHPDDDGSLAVEMMEAEPAMIHFHLEPLLINLPSCSPSYLTSLAAALFLAADSPTSEHDPFSISKKSLC